MAGREKGVATAPCPTCGHDLNQIVQADGGVAYEACPSCYPPAAGQKEVAAAAPKREKATPVADPIQEEEA